MSDWVSAFAAVVSAAVSIGSLVLAIVADRRSKRALSNSNQAIQLAVAIGGGGGGGGGGAGGGAGGAGGSVYVNP